MQLSLLNKPTISYTLNWISVRLRKKWSFPEDMMVARKHNDGVWTIHWTVRWIHPKKQQRRGAPSSAVLDSSFPEPCCACICFVVMHSWRMVLAWGLGTQTERTSLATQTKSCSPDVHSSAWSTSTNTPRINCSRLEFMLNRKIN